MILSTTRFIRTNDCHVIKNKQSLTYFFFHHIKLRKYQSGLNPKLVDSTNFEMSK